MRHAIQQEKNSVQLQLLAQETAKGCTKAEERSMVAKRISLAIPKIIIIAALLDKRTSDA